MRQTASSNGIGVKAYAGTTGVLLAMNLVREPDEDFLGFAIEKLGSDGKWEWLNGMLPFPHMPHEAGQPIPSNVAPIQKFRWSDYTVNPGTQYRYRVHPVSGDAKQPNVGAGPSLTVATSGRAGAEHQVLFNRAAAASQAFARKFQTVNQLIGEADNKSDVQFPSDALVWLSRGVKEAIVSFIERALDQAWALDVAIYQYELQDVVDAINAAHNRGVKVRVVYHSKTGDPQTGRNEASLNDLPDSAKRARETSKIFHHKFIVLSRVDAGTKAPEAVLCGSTNFTHNGVYRQANVVHILARPDVAVEYTALFDELFAGKDPSATKKYINATNPIQPGVALFAGFSPRSKLLDLQDFIEEIGQAKRDVLFCTAFNLFGRLQDALLGKAHDAILRYGVQDKRSTITGFHADRTADFEATAMLSQGLEGFLRESLKGDRGTGPILIHTKLVVVDFTSDAPTVISGSHNFSKPASEGNDENFLIIKGNTEVADAYGCELMRLYDHYRFRFRTQEGIKAGKKPKRLTLNTDAAWTKRYFKTGSLEMSDRIFFAGGQLP
jgi:PLD-like domain